MTATRYRHGAHEVEALRFDGSADAASTICARFGGAVFRSGEQLEVRAVGGCVYVGADTWIIRDRGTRAMSVLGDYDFGRRFEPVDDAATGLPAVRRGGH